MKTLYLIRNGHFKLVTSIPDPTQIISYTITSNDVASNIHQSLNIGGGASGRARPVADGGGEAGGSDVIGRSIHSSTSWLNVCTVCGITLGA
jgi:hypothetical protein